MSVSSLTTGSQSSTLALINGTGETSSSTTASSVVAQSQGTDSAQFSKGGQLMSKLQSLQTSDPSEFKEAAQKISDSLAAAAKNTSDSNDAKHLTEMSEKFAEAAKSGSMSSLKPPTQPAAAQTSSEAGTAVAKFQTSGDHQAFFNTMNNAVESALSGVGDTAT